MQKEIRNYPENLWNKGLQNLPQKPKQLFIRGQTPNNNLKFLTIIGPRRPSEYSIKVVDFILNGLAGLPINIVSGLAIGIDALVHELAIKNNLNTIAFPGSGLDEKVLYPRTNVLLANQIIEKGGALISEYSNDQSARPYFFPQRNRLMAGISDAVLIIEASKKSGSMITAGLALEYNKEVLCIPGSIFNQNAEGVNELIKQGATPICHSNEIISLLGLEKFNDDSNESSQIPDANFSKINLDPQHKTILNMLKQGKSHEQIIQEVNISIKNLSQIISVLEIEGVL
jgi:DNA processing protein